VSDLSADLLFAHRLADEADRVSMRSFRSDELRLTTKGDGTPVAIADQLVEKAMLRLVLAEQPEDSLVGEEIGVIPGLASRRWIFDGIDGTHNYGPRRTGWGTIVALERDGEPVIGLVSAPALGRRWWAERGSGAWSAPSTTDGVELGAAERLHVSSATSLEGAKVCVIPWKGVLEGWRSDVAGRFVPPTEPRSQCIALDAVMVAEGRYDGAVIMLGGIWDYAATQVVVEEAGGRFSSAWGDPRLDTATGVFTTPGITDDVLAVIAEHRPDVPDAPVFRTTTLKPVPKDWTDFGLRALTSMSARRHVEHAPPLVFELVDERAAELAKPFVGITTDGVVRTGLRGRWSGPKVSTAPVIEEALAFLEALSPSQRSQATFAMDAIEWRQWFNVHMNHFRHGLMLEDLAPPQREAALAIVRATLSARGYTQARNIMRINELVAELTGDYEAFGEWPYFISIFGSPTADRDEPWGWQIDGHHLCVNCVVFDDRIVTTPTFMGSEPRRIERGWLAGVSMFDPEEALGLDLIRSLDDAQRARAIIYPSIHPDLLPAHLQNLADGRMQAGAFHDNAVLPYQGVAGSSMSDGQRGVLLALTGTYLAWNADRHAEVRMSEVATHLDETWFSWYGGYDDESPFYYRVHSPVILIEFDHHPGVVFDNEVPTRHHVHTLVRTPNGGDYGTDLLRQHYERFDHTGGRHAPHEHR
jgi:fructose-1,6-bisphosphatase/inositol monophosphatase family enzyme